MESVLPGADNRSDAIGLSSQDMAELDNGIEANGILEVMPDGFGFIRCGKFFFPVKMMCMWRLPRFAVLI